MEVNASKRTLLSSVCWRNVSSTRKPLRATFVAGAIASARSRLPHLRSALSHVAGVPGTPTETPLVTSSGVKL